MPHAFVFFTTALFFVLFVPLWFASLPRVRSRARCPHHADTMPRRNTRRTPPGRCGGHFLVGIEGNAVAKKTGSSAGAGGAGVPVSQMVESVIGCKWSLHVLACVRKGIVRPGAMERAAPGLTAKVLSERLDKFVRFGVLDKRSFPESPPRVEYSLTPFGEKFVRVIDEVEKLQSEVDPTSPSP
jgi:DNA-binding HxlR family transcriptional regulator